MNIKIDWLSTIAAIGIVVTALVFPFVNACEEPDSKICTHTHESFTHVNFYGVNLYLP